MTRSSFANSIQTITAEELLGMPTSSQDKFIVNGILPIGLSILGAAPKQGKSVLSTQLACAVASGTPFLGQDVITNHVLYISLEEKADNFKSRLEGLSPFHQRLQFAFTLPSQRMAKITYLKAYLRENPRCKLVIIDIFEKFKGDSGGTGYAAEYQTLTELKEMADRYQVALLLLHHTVKASSKDWLASMYGSNAVPGACDGVLFLERFRGCDDAVLHVTGRCVHDQDLELRFNREKISWDYISKETVYRLTGEREELLRILLESNGVLELKHLARLSNRQRSTTANLLKKLANSGHVEKPRYGLYCLTPLGREYLKTLD